LKQPNAIFLAAVIAVPILSLTAFAADVVIAEKPAVRFSPLPIGSVEPKGWILAQMSTDAVDGMAGHFIELHPKFGSVSWIEKNGSGGAGEMGGNWIDGYVRMAYLTGIPEAKKRADDFLKDVLGARDDDGYIGNYPLEKRYNSRMTGELWMQSRIYVALLAYYELTGNQEILDAVIKATKLTMSKYGPENSPFHLTPEERAKGKKRGRDRTVNGHSLMFVDVLEWLYRLTGDRSYPAFAAFLYQDFSSSNDVETKDIQLYSLMNMKYPFFWHGVHTVEHLRAPLFLAYADGSELYRQASKNSFVKLQKHIVPSGSCASDEGVMDHLPFPDQSYEYCTTTELSTSLESALQKTGEMKYADMIERAVFNAAQGARTPDGKCIAYLSSATLPSATEDHDLPYAGTKRHKLSPAHDIGGACCSANAVKIMPYYTCSMWMKSVKDNGLAALLFGPSKVHTVINGTPVTIDEETSYPFSDTVTFTVSAKTPVSFPLTIRIPEWAGDVRITASGAEVAVGENTRTVTKIWQTGDKVTVDFENPIIAKKLVNGELSINRGPLLYVYSWPAKQVRLDIQEFNVPGFEEYNVVPKTAYDTSGLYIDCAEKNFGFSLQQNPEGNALTPWADPPIELEGTMRTYDRGDKYRAKATLVPMGSTLLRFASFRIWPFDEQYFETHSETSATGSQQP